MSRRMRQGAGAPTFCWQCNRQLQRAPGKGMGLFYFELVQDRAGVEHRVHGFPCLQQAVADGAKHLVGDAPTTTDRDTGPDTEGFGL